MIFWHRTTSEYAAAILREGFRDRTGQYFTMEEYTGVWLSDIPLEPSPRADALLRVQLDCREEDIRDYEWVELAEPEKDVEYGGAYPREWLIPAAFINARATVSLATDEDAYDE